MQKGQKGLSNFFALFLRSQYRRPERRENAPTETPMWDDSFRSIDNNITTAYTQNYKYDSMGNILQLQHIGADNFTRNFNYNSSHNKLQSVDIGMNNYAFTYDENGNQLSETSSRKMEWDAADRMRCFYIEASGSISQYTHYLYDAGGNRVKKLTRTSGGNYDSTTYIDSIFEYKTDGSDEQNTLHIMDSLSRQSGNRKRIATLRIGDDFGDTKPAIKYNLEDHLGSSTMQLQTSGADINKEEYYPFGETSFGSYTQKRYRYCGKERDEESGMYYYGMRYYNAWTCRFVSVDPLKDKYAYYTPYQYAGNKPIISIDIDGLEGNNDTGQQTKTVTNSASQSQNSPSKENINLIVVIASADDIKKNELDKTPNRVGQWNIVVASSASKALHTIEERYKEKGINTLIFHTHGSGGTMQLSSEGLAKIGGGGYNTFKNNPSNSTDKPSLSEKDFSNYKKETEAFSKIVDKIANNGNLIVGACWAGLGLAGEKLGKELRELTFGKVNIFLNQDFSVYGSYNSQTKLNYGGTGINKGLLIYDRMTQLSDFKEGWLKFSTNGNVTKLKNSFNNSDGNIYIGLYKGDKTFSDKPIYQRK